MEAVSEYLNYIGKCACNAMLKEVAASPKPGLVDRWSSGAHRDMDYHTFLKSATVILPYLEEMALLGARAAQARLCSRPQLFEETRRIGRECEKAMFAATGGVNTHKGIIFSLGLICTAAAYTYVETGRTDAAAICENVKGMTVHVLEDFARCGRGRPLTKGEILYQRYGLTGIRGEAHAGFTSARRALLILQELMRQGHPPNNVYLQTLLHIMTELTDTNVIARHDLETLYYVQETARAVLDQGGALSPKGLMLISEVDVDFTRRNISPGGCADTLCLAIMLYELGLWEKLKVKVKVKEGINAF